MPWGGAQVPSEFCVVGDAPTVEDIENHEPFSDTAGRLFRRMLDKSDLPDADQWTFLYAVSCADKWGRSPNPRQVQACRRNLNSQLLLIDPQYVIFAGPIALNALRPNYLLSEVKGKPFHLQGKKRVGFAVQDPHVLASYGDENTPEADALLEDFYYLANVIEYAKNEHGLRSDLFSSLCFCGTWASRYNSDGLGWCSRHADRANL